MPTDPAFQPGRPAPDPCRVDGLLMFALTVDAVEKIVSPAWDGELPGTGLRSVREYVLADPTGGASLLALHQDLVRNERHDERWQLAIPDPDAPHPELARIQVLTLVPGDDPSNLERKLRGDTRNIAYVHRPAVRRPLQAQPSGQPFDPDDPQWGLAKCGFRDVWQTLQTGPFQRSIGIIDKGGDQGHPELTSVISRRPQGRRTFRSDHASAVAAVVAAIRTNQAGERLVGCCSAKLDLYNVWPDGRFDPCAYYRALWAVARDRLPVVNLSIGWTCADTTEQFHIEACYAEDVVVVAAMGNEGPASPPLYPAAYEGIVVAVGGVNASDQPVASSSRGSHMWISAPGERILTVDGRKGYAQQDGTSFAAPFVTAAVWLARRYRRCLTVDQVRCVLKQSVAPETVPKNKRKRSASVGHGRLDMRRMVEVLDKMKCPPREESYPSAAWTVHSLTPSSRSRP